jgi:ParB-like chromosome segregation protein Spo0J
MRILQIELLPIHALRPRDRNARTHSKRQIRQIRESILKFGFNNPILVDDDSHIIAGHGRVEAAKGLNITTVPAVRLSHLNEAEKRAYVIADNRLGWQDSNHEMVDLVCATNRSSELISNSTSAHASNNADFEGRLETVSPSESTEPQRKRCHRERI